jgi:hypothetical protein
VPPEPTSSTATDDRRTKRDAPNRAAGKKNREIDRKGTAGGSGESAPAASEAKVAPAPLTDAQRAAQARNSALGLAADRHFEFRDSKRQSSWVHIDEKDVRFVDNKGKTFLTLNHATMSEILVTTGYAIQEASLKYRTASEYHQALLKEYYAYFRRGDGNELAQSRFGSGRFRYELAKQHLSDSIPNQLRHAFWKTGQKALEDLVAPLADTKPGMECYGTTMLNVLKARGLVPPSLSRAEFEVTYANVFKNLPKGYQHHLLVGGGGGVTEAKDTLDRLSTSLSKLDWARFTGMSGAKPLVQAIARKDSGATEADIAALVKDGYAVFVHVPGHFKSAIGGTAGDLKYDDPLGTTGKVLYGNKRASYGVVVK